MKILWIDLNSSYAHSSLACPALHAQLQGENLWEWDMVSATINEGVNGTVNEICNREPDIIMATAWLFNQEKLMHIIDRVKALRPQTICILGGPEFLGNNEAFLRKYPSVDCVFRGEGEEQFPNWLACWNKLEEWKNITGLCYIDSNNHYQDNGLAKVFHFDQLKFPEESPYFNWDKPFVQLETTRGCFNTCAFCVSGGEKPVRILPIETIRRRLQNIYAHHIKDVRVLDRTFNYHPQRAKELLQLFREFHPHMRFHLEIHPALLSKELKEELQSVPKGLLHLEAGIQSLHEAVLEKCQRKGKLADALEGLKFLCSLDNIVTHADLIAGLPLYHLHDIFDDIRTLASYRTGEIQLELLKLLPGTEMRRKAKELGIIYSPMPPYEVLQTNEMSFTELELARQLSRLLDAYYNAPAWQAITRKLILYKKRILHDFFTYLLHRGLIDQPLSLERRGMILYEYCKENCPEFQNEVSVAWIEAGMSLKKQPAERVKTKRQTPPEFWTVIYGTYNESLRLCFLPTDDEGLHGYWFGFESETQKITPVFKAQS